MERERLVTCLVEGKKYWMPVPDVPDSQVQLTANEVKKDGIFVENVEMPEIVRNVPPGEISPLELPKMNFEPPEKTGKVKPAQQTWNEDDYDGTVLPLPEIKF